MIYGNYIGRNRYSNTRTLEGGNFSAVPWLSGLINGKGRYIDKLTGKSFFFRVLNTYKILIVYFILVSLLFVLLVFSFIFGEKTFNPFQAKILFRKPEVMFLGDT